MIEKIKSAYLKVCVFLWFKYLEIIEFLEEKQNVLKNKRVKH